MLEAAVGMSREWDAFHAGAQVAREIRAEMRGTPKFALFFSTIHYKRNGGLRRLLEGFYSVMPRDVKLVGGTMAGFVNRHGVFTRGATALAVCGDEMDVAMGIGRNTKRTPEMAGRRCAEALKHGLKGSKYANKYAFEFTCSGIVPKLPFFGSKRVIRLPKQLDRLTVLGLSLATNVLQIGVGREDDVVRRMSEVLGDFTIIGGSTLDDNRWESSYQYFNSEVHTNSVVALGVQTDLCLEFSTSSGLVPTGLKMKPTKTGLYGCAIRKIEGKPAAAAFMEKLGWADDMYDEGLHRRTLYYPLSYTKDGEFSSRVLALVVGSNLIFTNVVGENELEINRASGRTMIGCVDAGLEKAAKVRHKAAFSFIVSCCARLEALGAQTYKVHKKMADAFEGLPFLGIYASGEDICLPGRKHTRLNETFNLASFYK